MQTSCTLTALVSCWFDNSIPVIEIHNNVKLKNHDIMKYVYFMLLSHVIAVIII